MKNLAAKAKAKDTTEAFINLRQANADLLNEIREYVLDLLREQLLRHVNATADERLSTAMDWVRTAHDDDFYDPTHAASRTSLLANFLTLVHSSIAANALAKMALNQNYDDAQYNDPHPSAIDTGARLMLSQDRGLVDIVHALTRKGRKRIFNMVIGTDVPPDIQASTLVGKLETLVEQETERALSKSVNANGLAETSILDVPEFETLRHGARRRARKVWANVRDIVAKNAASPRDPRAARQSIQVDIHAIPHEERLLIRLAMLNASVSFSDTILHPAKESAETWRRFYCVYHSRDVTGTETLRAQTPYMTVDDMEEAQRVLWTLHARVPPARPPPRFRFARDARARRAGSAASSSTRRRTTSTRASTTASTSPTSSSPCSAGPAGARCSARRTRSRLSRCSARRSYGAAPSPPHTATPPPLCLQLYSPDSMSLRRLRGPAPVDVGGSFTSSARTGFAICNSIVNIC